MCARAEACDLSRNDDMVFSGAWGSGSPKYYYMCLLQAHALLGKGLQFLQVACGLSKGFAAEIDHDQGAQDL